MFHPSDSTQCQTLFCQKVNGKQNMLVHTRKYQVLMRGFQRKKKPEQNRCHIEELSLTSVRHTLPAPNLSVHCYHTETSVLIGVIILAKKIIGINNPVIRCLNFPLIQEKLSLAKCWRLTIFFRTDTKMIPESFTEQVSHLCVAALWSVAAE